MKNQIKEKAVETVRKHRSPIGVCMLIVLALFIAGQIIAGPKSWPFPVFLFFLALLVHFSKTHYGKTFLAFILLTMFFVGFLYVKGATASPKSILVSSVRVETPIPTAIVAEIQGEQPVEEKALPKPKKNQGVSCKKLKKFDKNIQQWCDLILKNSAKYDLDPVLVASIIQVESGGNQDSISHQGAVGIMQIMSSDSGWSYFTDRPTQAQLLKPKTNIEWGCKILSGYIKEYGSVRDGVMHYGPTNYGYIYADDVLSIYNKAKGKSK